MTPRDDVKASHGRRCQRRRTDRAASAAQGCRCQQRGGCRPRPSKLQFQLNGKRDTRSAAEVAALFDFVKYSSSCRATKRSSNFDSTLRFEIGRYDLASARSRSAFFNSGVMYADLKIDGTTPSASDRLNSSTMNGASASTLSFN